MSEQNFDISSQNLSPLETKRHSLAHILGAAITEIYPGTKLGIGPVIEDGFYYDVETTTPITSEDLKKIEEKMIEIISRNDTFTRREVTKDEALEFLKRNNQTYKIELVNELPTDAIITFYDTGEFNDLCRGPHVNNSSELANCGWTLNKIAGAYWRGSEKNQMLTRVYGVAFETKDELAKWQYQMEEAIKRDHRKLGKELKLFTISDLVGPGLPLLQPNGMIIKRLLEDYLWDIHKTKGYQRVWTPHLAKEELYVMSGHAGHYMDDMFNVWGGSSKEKFYVKPMNCPHHYQIYADNQFSYRDMPIRYFEQTTVYRDEKTGQLSGLTRVRSITQDDGHLFCRVNQITEEVSTIVGIIKEFYTTIGMWNDYWVRLSTRGEDKSVYMGSDEVWAKAEEALEKAAKENELNYKPGPGEAAFYGPKLDFMFKDAIGREWQLATIQCDFNAPERFDLSFVNEQGEKERPVVIHRAISGSLERFMGVLIEHYAGAFPLWLNPVQVMFVSVSEKFNEQTKDITNRFKNLGLRAEMDGSSESVGKKVRNAASGKIPYIVVVGEKELAGEAWQIKVRGMEEQRSMTETQFTEDLLRKIKTRSLEI